MNNEVKVSDMDKFDENIEKLTSILNNSRTTKRALLSTEIIDNMILFLASKLADKAERELENEFDLTDIKDIIEDYMKTQPDNFCWSIYTECLSSDNVEISKAINSVNPQEVHVDTKALDGLFKAVASMASLFLTHLVAIKLDIE